jgi:hypothetical protein
MTYVKPVVLAQNASQNEVYGGILCQVNSYGGKVCKKV